MHTFHRRRCGDRLARACRQAALAEDMTGVTSDSIKIGNTVPYSGPAAPYGTLGRSMSAYFDTVNKAGGVAGHKIIFLSRDDAYSPPKTVEQTRKLVEEDQVAFIYALGRHRGESLGAQIPQLETCAAIERAVGRQHLERPEGISLVDVGHRELRTRRQHGGAIHPQA